MTKEITVADLYRLIAEKKQPNVINVRDITCIWNKECRIYEDENHNEIVFTASTYAANTRVKCFYPVLDNTEKNYLSAVIKPFRNKVVSIVKKKNPVGSGEYLNICVKATSHSDNAALPDFEVGTMYKGMELWKPYTLEDLGL